MNATLFIRHGRSAPVVLRIVSDSNRRSVQREVTPAPIQRLSHARFEDDVEAGRQLARKFANTD